MTQRFRCTQTGAAHTRQKEFLARTMGVTAPALLPLGAVLLAGSVNAWAQPAPEQNARRLSTVIVTEQAETPEGKDAYQANESTIGKGRQKLRDIPQSVTIVTEKLMDDRNLDTVKEALKNTAGISFQAAEGGEEDIRLRGFTLQGSGDVFADGMRDPAFYDRDTFNLDRLEVLRGSASMLFGRGSTGGAVNQINKVPRLIDEHQVDLTVGNHNYRRMVGDFNLHTGDSAALRLNLMDTQADNNGAGSSLNKHGVAATYRWGIGERDEFSAGIYHLDNANGINYGIPWIREYTGAPASDTTLLPIDPSNSYGMASDFNKGTATYANLSHLHRFDDGSELKTQLRRGAYERDQRSGAIRFAAASQQPGGVAANLDNLSDATVLTRGTHLKMQDMDNLLAQSDYSTKFEALGYKHELLTGVDIALERKRVYADTPGLNNTTRTAFYTELGLNKPTTTVGTPGDGASINEALRVKFLTSRYESAGWGAYLQDLIQVAPMWKVLAGLRFDHLIGNYDTLSYSYSGSSGTHGYDKFSHSGTTGYQMTVAGWSQRLGALYQPTPLASYHVSLGTSFNTSADAYSINAQTVNTPPEQSANFELGAKLDSADKRYTTRVALFHTVKYHERNTDPLLNIAVLSGRRHVSGAEVDIAGRITPKWEVYGSFMWMPDATIDVGAEGAEGEGQRPSLTPIYSGTLWNTYQVTAPLRVGAGLNVRGEQTPNRNPGWKVPAYATLDLMAEYRISERYSLKGNVTNVSNKLYADQLYSGHYVPGAGRLLQLTFSAKL